jgi:hypothetical protein
MAHFGLKNSRLQFKNNRLQFKNGRLQFKEHLHVQHVLHLARQNCCTKFSDIETCSRRDNTEENRSVWFLKFRSGVTFIKRAEYLARLLFLFFFFWRWCVEGSGKHGISHYKFVPREQTVSQHFSADVLWCLQEVVYAEWLEIVFFLPQQWPFSLFSVCWGIFDQKWHELLPCTLSYSPCLAQCDTSFSENQIHTSAQFKNGCQLCLQSSEQMTSGNSTNQGRTNFPKNLGPTSKFCAPETWREASSILRTRKY